MRSVLQGLAARGWLIPLADMGRRITGYYEVLFLGAALRSGVLQRLGDRASTAEELAAHLGFDPDMRDGLHAWLDLGVTIGVLGRRGSRYSVRSRSARALLKRGNDPIAAFYEELAILDPALIVETPERLAAGRPFEIRDADAAVIARSSRMSEPWLEAAIAEVIPSTGPVRLLEIGCGAGALMRAAVRLSPELTAIGVELQEGAAEVARRNLAEWGIGDRASVEVGDIRERQGSGEFDVVTLHQNIYYFPEAEQGALFGHLRTFLRAGGTLLVTSIVRDSGAGSAALDLWGGMTAGASRLPVPRELEQRMRAGGLADVRGRRLGPDGMYWSFVGTA